MKLIMDMKRIVGFLCFPLALLISCESQKTVKNQPQQAGGGNGGTVSVSTFEEDVPPHGLRSQAEQESDKQDVRDFIRNLNDSIRRRDYDSWRAALSSEYFDEISSPEFLAVKSNERAMRMQKIVLKTPRDYFDKVVVPSRSSSRLEVNNIELEYITQTRVKVFPVSPEGVVQENHRLYELERVDNKWIIIN